LPTASDLIEGAFARLALRPGYVDRPDQRQLALLVSDLIEEKRRGAFEAPTGLGKSLAALIPAIAHAISAKRRVIVATYTNILAEQYWRNDLPLALSLFEGSPAPNVQFLIGRQRYACLAAMDEHAPDMVDMFLRQASLGIENEFRRYLPKSGRELTALWQKVAAPPVCPGRICPAYDSCFYYNARRRAEDAKVVITNHSVVLQDALMARSADDDEGGLLGKYDFLILDEAHDFPQAAINGLEFELSGSKLGALLGVGQRIESAILPLAQYFQEGFEWAKVCANFRADLEGCQKALVSYSVSLGQPGILTAAPGDVLDHPQVQRIRLQAQAEGAKEVATAVSDACERFVKAIDRRMDHWRDLEPDRAKPVADAIRGYGVYLREYGIGCFSLFDPTGVSVSYVSQNGPNAMLRSDVIGLAEPLRELLWDRAPFACLSATLALDGTFDFFRQTTGIEPDFEEILPSPFDHGRQAAIYLPKRGVIPDPTVARREGSEEYYFRALAYELSQIIRTLGGRTLALFHSRKEMEGVFRYMDVPPELPILMQAKAGASTVGERFLARKEASLFALRSFWTGFDAPGETLSCVALVRIPFEVPVEPPQIARLAYLQTQGRDAFREHTLPLAKMIMRQGAGRLIRRADDTGVIALLDPRLRSKPYGEEILNNLPTDLRVFDDLSDAIGWVGLETSTLF